MKGAEKENEEGEKRKGGRREGEQGSVWQRMDMGMEIETRAETTPRRL